MTQIFGDFIEMENEWHEYLKIGFSPTKIPIQQRWRNNGLSADFLADYLTTFFPGEDSSSLEKQAEIKDAVSYIANELLENAMKFSHASSQHSVSIGMYLREDQISLYVTNSLNPYTTKDFQNFIQRLLTEDTSGLYMEQLTRNNACLGFLTMLNDYGVRLAWKFEPLEPNSDVMMVTTMAQLTI